MVYNGKGIKIPFGQSLEKDTKDEIEIRQQHCGGTSVCVFSGPVKSGGNLLIFVLNCSYFLNLKFEKNHQSFLEKFRCRSKRHKNYPFSVSIYVNKLYDCRISTCCEYRHSLYSQHIGGETGHFYLIKAVGGEPCNK